MVQNVLSWITNFWNSLSYFDYYIIAINVIGVIAYIVNMILYRFTADKQIDKVITVLSLLGAAIGILLFIILFDRKAGKERMMSRVFVICVFIIEVVLLLVLHGHHVDKFTIAFWRFFADHKWIFYYLAVINFVTFAMFAVDKVNAAEHRSRIRIITLLGMAFIGGSPGALLGMYLLHHKTRKDYFTVGVPLIIVMQIVVLFYIMNAEW